jgi:hypothetical protein
MSHKETQDKYLLYVDMDMVLSDFDRHIKKHMGIPLEEDFQEYMEKNKAKNKMWATIRKTKGLFWSTMPPLIEDVANLWETLEALETVDAMHILSRPDRSDLETCIRGKHEWLDKHLGPDRVPKHRRFFELDKSIYATPKSILIDDCEENVSAWIAKGGIGILFDPTNPKESYDKIIKRLREMNTNNFVHQ